MDMRISVIVPIYNGENTLRRCMDSLLGQTLGDIEILAVDNGSEDGSRSILDEYAANDKRVKVLSLSPNQGPSGARNAGLDRAEGEYIAFCDCDDSMPAGACEALWKASQNGTADIVCGNYLEVIKAGGGETRRRKCGSAPFDRYMGGNAVWGRFFRLAFLKENNLRFEPYHYGEDTLFVAQAYRKASVVGSARQVVYRYTNNVAGTLANTHCLTGLREYIDVQRRVLRLLPDEAARYCLGHTAYLKEYWWQIPDLEEKEEGLLLLKDYVKDLPWERHRVSFETIFGVDLPSFLSMDLGRYIAARAMYNEKEMVLLQFAEGQIGARYIAKYSLAWLQYKLTRIKRGNK